MGDWINAHLVTWFLNHHEFFEGMVLAFLLAQPKMCAVLLFKGLIKIPGVGPWIARNPKKADAWLDDFHQAIDDCVAKYAAEHTEKADSTPPPAPQVAPEQAAKL